MHLQIYVCGVIGGSLASAIVDSDTYLAGASGGVYAIIAAHLANVVFNWAEMEFPALRLAAFLMLAIADTGVAIYYRYQGVDTEVSYAAHIAGAVAGLLLGLVVLRNLQVKRWERVVWWLCLILFLALLMTVKMSLCSMVTSRTAQGIVWNAVIIAMER